MALFELDDIFGYQQANDIKRFWAGGAAPVNPGDGEVWLDTSVTPIALKRYDSTSEQWSIFAGGIAVDSDGNIGIGTSTPAYPISLETSGKDASITAVRTDGASAYISADTSRVYVGSFSNHEMRLVCAGIGRVTIDTDGKVGVGTNTPVYTLEVERTGENAQVVTHRTDGVTSILSSTDAAGFVGTMSNHDFRITVNDSTRVTVDTDGRMGIGTTSPGYRLEVNGNTKITGTLFADDQLAIPTSQPTTLVNGSIWIA